MSDGRSWKDGFSLATEATAESVRVYVPGGRARLTRLAVYALGLSAVSVLSWLLLDGDWTGLLYLWGSVAALLCLYEPFEVAASVDQGKLTITMKPLVYRWIGGRTADIETVTDATARLAFVALHRPDGRQLLFVPLPHLTTAEGETSNQRIASFITRPSRGGETLMRRPREERESSHSEDQERDPVNPFDYATTDAPQGRRFTICADPRKVALLALLIVALGGATAVGSELAFPGSFELVLGLSAVVAGIYYLVGRTQRQAVTGRQ